MEKTNFSWSTECHFHTSHFPKAVLTCIQQDTWGPGGPPPGKKNFHGKWPKHQFVKVWHQNFTQTNRPKQKSFRVPGRKKTSGRKNTATHVYQPVIYHLIFFFCFFHGGCTMGPVRTCHSPHEIAAQLQSFCGQSRMANQKWFPLDIMT